MAHISDKDLHTQIQLLDDPGAEDAPVPFSMEQRKSVYRELLEARALLRFLEIHLEVCGDTVLAGKVAIHRTKWDGGEG